MELLGKKWPEKCNHRVGPTNTILLPFDHIEIKIICNQTNLQNFAISEAGL